MFKDFREFALKGNVVDLAIGVIIGAAFGKIIDSLVKDIIMPVIGSITGWIDFSNHYLPLSAKAADAANGGAAYDKVKQAGAVLGYGEFLTITVNFLIIAFILFLVVRAINTFHAKPSVVKAPPREEVLLEEIRDLLARQTTLPH